MIKTGYASEIDLQEYKWCMSDLYIIQKGTYIIKK